MKKKYSISLKSSPLYIAKLNELYKGKINKSKFPHGVIWFTLTNNISLELTSSLLLISYMIAKAGY